MTAAQKTAKANFKKAIEYRKKTGVSLKEAFAHVYGKKVGAAPKKKATKKAAPKKAAKKVVKKKSAPKKVANKAAPKKHTKYGKVKAHTRRVAGVHKDTKSHNVNIRVVSGVGKSSYAIYHNVTSEIDKAKKYIIIAENNIIRLKSFGNSPTAKKSIKMLKEYIKEQKTHITQLKKHI
jgi:serine/threonine protein kinase